MNLSKIINYGTMFKQFHQSLLFSRSVGNANKHPSLIQSAFFSHFCNISRCAQGNKLFKSPFGAVELISRSYKIRGHLQLRCKDCYLTRKDGEIYVLCSSYPRHKQKKLTKRTKYSWILTHAFHSKFRPY